MPLVEVSLEAPIRTPRLLGGGEDRSFERSDALTALAALGMVKLAERDSGCGEAPFSMRPTTGLGSVTNNTIYGLWSALRCHVVEMSEKDFSAANRIAKATRAKLAADDHWGRIAIAFAFSRDPSHAIATLKERAVGRSRAVDLLLVASPTVVDARPILESCMTGWGCQLCDIAFDLVESFDADAAPLLGQAVAAQKKAQIPSSERRYNLAPLEAALRLVS